MLLTHDMTLYSRRRLLDWLGSLMKIYSACFFLLLQCGHDEQQSRSYCGDGSAQLTHSVRMRSQHKNEMGRAQCGKSQSIYQADEEVLIFTCSILLVT